MSLQGEFDRYPLPDLGVRVCRDGRAAPFVQYAVACMLASRPAVERRPDAQGTVTDLELALRALRPMTEIGSPWTAIDPSLAPLREGDFRTKSAFFRMIGGADGVVERATMKVKPRNITLDDSVKVTARVTALSFTEGLSGAADLDVQFGFGKEYTDYNAWTTWAPMILTGGKGLRLFYEGEWKPATAGCWWVMARCRAGNLSWSYVGKRGYNISNPLKTGRTGPAEVKVAGTAGKPEVSPAELIAASIERIADALDCICHKPPATGDDLARRPPA